MMVRKMVAALTIAVLCSGGLVGCGSDGTTGLPDEKAKPLTPEESDRIAKQVQEGMKQGYKGAPGAPFKKK